MDRAAIVEQALSLREKASACSRDEESRAYLDSAIELLESQIREKEDDAIFAQLGITWYNYPTNSKERCVNVSNYLGDAVLLNPQNKQAWLYLGHYYFDEAKYDNALKAFRRYTELALEDRKSLWFDLKLRELILCCQVYLNPMTLPEESLKKILQDYLEKPVEDLPLPTELISCLSKLDVALSDNYKNTIEAISQRLQ